MSYNMGVKLVIAWATCGVSRLPIISILFKVKRKTLNTVEIPIDSNLFQQKKCL